MKSRTSNYIGTFPNTPEGQLGFKIVSQTILRNPHLLQKFIKSKHSTIKKVKAVRMYRNGIRKPHSNSTLKLGSTHFDGYIRELFF